MSMQNVGRRASRVRCAATRKSFTLRTVRFPGWARAAQKAFKELPPSSVSAIRRTAIGSPQLPTRFFKIRGGHSATGPALRSLCISRRNVLARSRFGGRLDAKRTTPLGICATTFVPQGRIRDSRNSRALSRLTRLKSAAPTKIAARTSATALAVRAPARRRSSRAEAKAGKA